MLLYVWKWVRLLHGALHMHPPRRPGALGHPCGRVWFEEKLGWDSWSGAVRVLLTVSARL